MDSEADLNVELFEFVYFMGVFLFICFLNCLIKLFYFLKLRENNTNEMSFNKVKSIESFSLYNYW